MATTSGVFLFLRRLRRPLLVIVSSYAVATLGLVLIPGADAEGRPVHLDFLHAFYIVSYTGTTIGYGEIPNAFTEAQRLWMVLVIYVTVTAWVYSIGSIIATLQDPAFNRVIGQRRFASAVKAMRQPFYLVCGYGDSGTQLVRELRRYQVAVVVLDIDQQRLDALAMQDLGMSIPAFVHDAVEPENLVAAGLTDPHCIGVVAMTGSDEVNLAVAMSARLLNPRIPAICRSYRAETTANMASFGTRHIVNPFVAFAERIGLTFRAPSAHVIHESLTSSHRTPMDPLLRPPIGRWVVCGYGRFGQAVVEELRRAGNTVTVVESDPARAAAFPGAVQGIGTEAATLSAADVETAVGVVAGTDNGINNLSIVVTARELNPTLFTVAREVSRTQRLLFQHADLDLRVQLTWLAATEAVEVLRNPMLPIFLQRLAEADEAWAAALLARMAALIGDESPSMWEVSVTPDSAPAVAATLRAGRPVAVGLLARDPRDRDCPLAAVPLLLRRAGQVGFLPEDGFPLQQGDEILYCGRRVAEERMSWARHNVDVLAYLATGAERPSGWVWRRGGRAAPGG